MLASRGGMEQEPLHSFILLQAMAVLRPVYPTEAAQSGHNGTKTQGQRSYSSINQAGLFGADVHRFSLAVFFLD